MIDFPIDPPREDANIEEIVRWLREFADDYNQLKDKVREQTKGVNNG